MIMSSTCNLTRGRVALSASDRITGIIESLKSFAGLDEAEYQKVDIHRMTAMKTIREIIDLMFIDPLSQSPAVLQKATIEWSTGYWFRVAGAFLATVSALIALSKPRNRS